MPVPVRAHRRSGRWHLLIGLALLAAPVTSVTHDPSAFVPTGAHRPAVARPVALATTARSDVAASVVYRPASVDRVPTADRVSTEVAPVPAAPAQNAAAAPDVALPESPDGPGRGTRAPPA